MNVYIIRNYNSFLLGTLLAPKWENFFIHRFNTDWKKLIKFPTKEEAEGFLDKNPELQKDFYAWIVCEDGSRCE